MHKNNDLGQIIFLCERSWLIPLAQMPQNVKAAVMDIKSSGKYRKEWLVPKGQTIGDALHRQREEAKAGKARGAAEGSANRQRRAGQ
ncbi:hypothetical protein [Pantoea eucrina]|uniref:Uncharacterized protein n=1 Tax=Pantoea eucrina TaxID=472693 RepID=A0ABU5LB08_9GAMM|nr:hypothetical protein [Pantoea eucrina]MDZ7277117.1 hypothetical protein [Pantoea eucrina]